MATGSGDEVSVPGGTGGGVTDMAPPPPPDVTEGVGLGLVQTVTVTWRLTPITGDGRSMTFAWSRG